MYVVRTGTTTPLLIALTSSTDHVTPVTGSTNPVAYLYMAGGISYQPLTGSVVTSTSQEKTLVKSTDYSWTEIDSTHMPGLYKFTPLSTGLFNQIGEGALYVQDTVAGSDPFRKDLLISLGADNDAFNVLTRLITLRECHEVIGGFQLDALTSGNATIQLWNLKDSSGNPTNTNPVERVPTITFTP